MFKGGMAGMLQKAQKMQEEMQKLKQRLRTCKLKVPLVMVW